MISKSDFRRLNNPPKNYIPGLSRGDTGFITRTDISSRETQKREGDKLIELQKQLQNRSANATDPVNFNDENYDKWQGFINFKLNNDNADDEDIEADKIFAKVDKALESKAFPNKKIKIDTPKKDNKDVPLKDLFIKEKDELKNLKEDDWMQIPEPNITKSKRNNKEKYTPNTDTNLIDAINKNSLDGIVVPDSNKKQTSDPSTNSLSKIDNAQAGSMTIIEKAGILSKINSSQFSEYQIQDVAKARLLFASLRESDPKNYKAWVASARLEELNGRVQEALNILNTGSSINPYSDDIYVELVRLSPKNKREAIINKALKFIADSPTLWKLKTSLISDREEKFTVTLKALEFCKNVESLWKQAVELADDDNRKRTLLGEAVRNIPESVDLWLAYAKLSTYEQAKKILNKANKMFRNSNIRIWMAAASLEEAMGEDSTKINKIVQRAFDKLLKTNEESFDKEDWFKEILSSYNRGNIITSENMIKTYVYYVIAQYSENWESLYKTIENDVIYLKDNKNIMLIYWLITELYSNLHETLSNRLSLYTLLNDVLMEAKYYDKILELIIAISNNNMAEAYNYALTWLSRLNDQGSISKDIYFNHLDIFCSNAIEKLGNNEDKAEYIHLLAETYIIGFKSTEKALKLTELYVSINSILIYNSLLQLQIDFTGNVNHIIQIIKHRLAEISPSKEDDIYELNKFLSQIYEKLSKFDEIQQIWVMFVKRYPNNQKGLIALAKFLKKHKSSFQSQAIIANLLKKPGLTLESCLQILSMYPPKSIEFKNAIIECKKKHPDAFKLKVIELTATDVPEKSKIVELLKENPMSVELQIYMAENLIKEGKIEKAKAWLLNVYNELKNNSTVISLLYYIYKIILNDEENANFFLYAFDTQLRLTDDLYVTLKEENLFEFKPENERMFMLDLLLKKYEEKFGEKYE